MSSAHRGALQGNRRRQGQRRPAYHTQPADLFIHMFDALPDSLFLGDEATRLNEDREVRAEAERVTDIVLSTGRADADMSALPTDSSRNRVAYARAVGLDNVLRHVHPKSVAPPPEALTGLAAWYVRKGRFNSSEEDGLLLPRLVDYGAPRHRPDKHESFCMIRVEPRSLEGVKFLRLPSRHTPTLRHGDHLTVACVPFLDSPDEITFARKDTLGIARYRLSPKPDAELRDRVDAAIDALDDSGAIVGLLPEATLSRDLLATWRQRLRATSHRRSGMALVIIGSGPVTDDEPPFNRAVVLTRDGSELWTQDKLCDFTLVPETVTSWGLAERITREDGLVGDPAVLDQHLVEDITRGDKFVVVETTAGRFGILICEDLQRCDTRHVVPRDFGVTHIFSPVFDAPLGDSRWERFAADRHLQWGGSRVAVSNSRVVGNALGMAATMTTAIGVTPKSMSGSWKSDVHSGDTSSATDCVVLRLPAADYR